MVALNILYLLVDETAMPKGSTVSLLSNLVHFYPPHTHAPTHAQNVNCRGARLSDLPCSWRRHKSNSGYAQMHVGRKGPDVNQAPTLCLWFCFGSSLKVISQPRADSMSSLRVSSPQCVNKLLFLPPAKGRQGQVKGSYCEAD